MSHSQNNPTRASGNRAQEQERGAVVLHRVVSPRKVVEYTSCPDCNSWSIGVQANGRIVRHSKGWGSVERPRNPRLIPTPICTGSGKLVRKRANAPHEPRGANNKQP